MLPMQGVQVQSLVRELRSHTLSGTAKRFFLKYLISNVFFSTPSHLRTKSDLTSKIHPKLISTFHIQILEKIYINKMWLLAL